jgi:hypothetical protein
MSEFRFIVWGTIVDRVAIAECDFNDRTDEGLIPGLIREWKHEREPRSGDEFELSDLEGLSCLATLVRRAEAWAHPTPFGAEFRPIEGTWS